MSKPIVDALYLLSATLDAMDITLPDTSGKTQEQVGGEMIMLFARKMHKAKKEINDLIRFISDKDPSEMTFKEILDTAKEFFQTEGVVDFFRSTVK